MTLKLEDKKAIVAEVNGIAAKSTFAVVAAYSGLTVAQMTELRSKARQIGVYLRVVRNTLARRAVQETEFACLQEVLSGPMVLLFSPTDPGDAARLIRDFTKENKLLEVKALALGGKLLAAKEIEAVANLPTRNEALASLMSVMTAPISKFVRTLAEPYAQCVRVMGAISEKKQAA